MSQKERIQRDIERIRARIATEQERLAVLQQKFEEIENSEILALVRAKRLTPLQLQEFLQSVDPHREIMAMRHPNHKKVEVEADES